MSGTSDETRPPLFLSCRLILSVISCVGFVLMYALRFNVVVTMPCMVYKKRAGSIETRLRPPHCMGAIPSAISMFNDTLEPSAGDYDDDDDDDDDDDMYGARFYWDKSIQAAVIGSFFWSYWITQVPGGWLAQRYGGKQLFGWATFACGVLTLLMPTAARLDYKALVTIRILIGFFQGVTWPAMFVIWSRWAPPMERQKLITFSLSGSTLGIVLTFPTANLLCGVHELGWTYEFYLTGFLTIVWCLPWQYYVYDSPEMHPQISRMEKEYIRHSLKDSMPKEDTHEMPWKAIISSRAVWSLIISHMSSNFSLYALMTYMPTYLHDVHYYSESEASGTVAIPYIGFFIACNASAAVYDLAIVRKLCTRNVARKTGNSIGLLLPALLLIVVGFVNCEYSILAVITLFVISTINGITYGAGFMTNVPEIAPQYTGVIFGISNTFATFSGWLSLRIIKELTANRQRSGWQTMFNIISCVFVISSCIFIFYGSGEIQQWAKTPDLRKYTLTASVAISVEEPDEAKNASERHLTQEDKYGSAHLVSPTRTQDDLYPPESAVGAGSVVTKSNFLSAHSI